MAKRVVLLAVDGLDWGCLRRGIAAGRLPEFDRLLSQGAHAEVEVKSCVPGLVGAADRLNSPSLWTTVATGQYYFQHGVYDFCNLLDSVEHPPLFESRHVRSPRIWDVLSHYGLPSLVVGYYVTHPAYSTVGAMVSDLFGETSSSKVTWPRELGNRLARALGAADYANLVETNETSAPTGPGTDTQGQREKRGPDGSARQILERFTALSAAEIARILSAPPDSDQRRLLDFRLVQAFQRDERFHRSFISLIQSESWRFATVYYRLIDSVCHGFWSHGLQLPEDFVRAYGSVVDEAYAWIDDCIREVHSLLTAEDVCLLLSDHGFGPSEQRTELEQCHEISEFSYGQHAEPAVLLVSGGGAGRFERVSLLDIAPTIFDYFDIPLADALDGGPVPGLLRADRGAPKRVPTYPYQCPQDDGEISDHEQRRVLKRLAALGYVDG